MPKKSILVEAENLVHGDRLDDYGHPLDVYQLCADLWNPILGTSSITPEKVALCMAALKLAREMCKHKRDNLVDAAGYFEVANMILIEKERREKSSH